ncbi:MAG: hypothetical protein P8Z36_07580 [Gemmatimonadota bacterium]|jgi:hypothetical protein
MRIALGLAVAAATQFAPAATQDLSYAGSIQYSTGSYIFTEPTHTLSFQNGLTATFGRLRLNVAIPAILQNSGAVTMVGGTYLPTGGEGHGAVGTRQPGQRVPMSPGGPRHSLLPVPDLYAQQVTGDSVVEEPGSYAFSAGDPLLGGALQLIRSRTWFRSLELTLNAKAPLNDVASGIGTGRWDMGAGGTAVASLGPMLAIVDVSYWWYGDLPELELRDGVSWAASLGLPVSRSLSLTAGAIGSNRIIQTAQPGRSISMGLLYRLSSRSSLSVSAGAGLSETSPAASVSLGWWHALRQSR